MRNTRFRWLALTLAVGLALAAMSCKGSSKSTATPQATGTQPAAATGTQPAAFTGTVKVGISTTLSGAIAQLGKNGLQGVTLAVDDLNAKGGLLGKKIEVVSADDQAKPDVGSTNVRNMILNDKVVAVFGPVSSAVAAAEEGIAAQNKIPIFFHTSNDTVLMTKQFTKYGFQVVPNTTMEPRAIAAYACQQPYTKWATIGPDYSYGHDTVDTFIKDLKACKPGVEVVNAQWPKLGSSDFTPYISAIQSAKPDALFLAIYGGDLVTFSKQAAGYNLAKQMKMFGAYSISALQPLGADAPAGGVTWFRAPIYLPDGTPGVDNAKIKTFIDQYHAKFGQWPGIFSILAYSAVQTWADGVKKANSFDGDKIAAALPGVTVSTVRGDIKIRACDHQAEIPEYVGTLSDQVNSTYGFRTPTNVFIGQPDKIMLTCAESEALRGK